MPTKPSGHTGGASTMSSQSDYRYLATFRDQHALASRKWAVDGRPWWGFREMAANRGDIDGFCTTPQPGDHERPELGQWDAPYMPDPIWFDYNWSKGTFRIRYDRIISHHDQVETVWLRRVNRLCSQNGWPFVERGETPREAIIFVHGEPPMSSRVFKAAQASHPWILGFSDEPDEELARMLNMTIPGAGIYNPPRKEGLVPVEKTLHLTEEQLEAKIARAVEAAMKAKPNGVKKSKLERFAEPEPA